MITRILKSAPICQSGTCQSEQMMRYDKSHFFYCYLKTQIMPLNKTINYYTSGVYQKPILQINYFRFEIK